MLKLRCAWIWRSTMRWHGFREHLGETDVEWGRPEPEVRT